ncbi:sensor histidine kinase [Duganella phyllosphaerae]|nr:sensor histidine kinase [Duganella phyllosphaerae]
MLHITLRALRLAARPVLLLLALAPAIGHSAPAPPPPPPQVFERSQVEVQVAPYRHSTLQHVAWRQRDGAPSAAIAITQDSRGMLWFANYEGLHRFDGARFDRVDAIDGNKLLAIDVSAVAAYGEALWVGYRFGGVSVFEHGAVTHYREAQGLPARTTQELARTQDGVMWAATFVGLFRRDGQRWTAVGPSDGVERGSFNHFTVAPNGALLAYGDSGLYIKQAVSQRFRRLSGIPGLQSIDSGDIRPDGTILLKTADRELFVLDPVTEVVRPLALPHFKQQRLDVYQEKQGRLWIMTPQGLYLVDPSHATGSAYSIEGGFSGRNVHTQLTDREGNAWFSTEAGVDRLSHGRINTLESDGAQAMYMSVLAGTDGEIWVGSNAAPMIGYDETLYRVSKDGNRIATPVRNPTASTRAADDSLWFAGSGMLWQVQGAQYRRWTLPAEVSGAAVQAMATDASGKLWLSIIGKGIHTFSGGVWGRPALPKLAARTAISLHRDVQDRLWFGYPENAVAILSADGVLRQVGTAEGLAAGNILAIKSHGGHVWIGGDHGLAWWNGERFRSLRDADGADTVGVSGIVENAAGELWLHGAGGLTQIAASDVAAVIEHGVQSVRMERFNHLDGYGGVAAQLRPIPTLTESSDGHIWYASSAYVGWIDPRNITHNPLMPTPQITGLRAEGRPHLANGAVRLPAGTENIELDFTAAVLTIPERARFRYRLAGFEDGWRDAGTRRQAFYTNMGPGDYRFEVLASNEDGVWSTQPATLDVSIAPTFVQTLWFKLLCALVLALAGYGLFRWRVQLATARVAERMQERLDERTRIARTLHDSFLQSVQALIMRFDRIKRGIAADDPLQREIDSALDTADAVLLEGREQVWALRSGDEAQTGLQPALEEAAAACGQQYGIAVRVEQNGLPVPLPDSVQREVHAIALEALHNACRHSGAASVQVALRYAKDGVELRVLDGGCGIDDQVLAHGAPHGHWGLAGMRERAHLINASLRISRPAGGGTEVRLHVPLSS